MTQAPSSPVVETKPVANVYTVLLIVAILALALAIGVVGHRLTGPVTEGRAEGAGYGLTVEQLFGNTETLPKASDAPARPVRTR